MTSPAGTATVIVPTHRGADRIAALLDSLRRQTVTAEVLVVDNASSDGTAQVLNRYPEVEVIRVEENLGFGRAVNLAARRAGGEAIVLVNDDCVLDPGFVEELTRPLGGEVVMSAGVLRDRADEGVIDTAGMELSRTLNVFDYLHGQPLTALGSRARPDRPLGRGCRLRPRGVPRGGGLRRGAVRLLGGRRPGAAAAPRGRPLRSGAGTLAVSMRTRRRLGFGSAEKNRLIGFGRGYVLRKWSVLRGSRALRVLRRGRRDLRRPGRSSTRTWPASPAECAVPGRLAGRSPIPAIRCSGGFDRRGCSKTSAGACDAGAG